MLKQFIEHVVHQSPLLAVYVGAIVLACVYHRRAPTPSILAIIGSFVLLLTSLASPLVFHYVTQRRAGSGHFDSDDLIQSIRLIGMSFGVAQALGIGLLVAAIFNGRSRLPDRGNRGQV